jgi:hypothetical protein
MKNPPTNLFQVKSLDGAFGLGSINLPQYPNIGDVLTVFDFPTVTRHRVERLDPRPEHWAHDWYEPVALVVRQEGDAVTGTIGNVLSLHGGGALPERLASVARVARKVVSEGLELNICYSDFAELCASAGVADDLSLYHAFAYEGIPMTVGEAGADWNASTCFTGYSDDLHTLYVTLPGNVPFVMNARFLSLAQDICAGQVQRQAAIRRSTEIASHLIEQASEAVDFGLVNAIDLILDGLLPAYDAAQEMTRVTLPSEAPRIERMMALRQQAVALRSGLAQEILDFLPKVPVGPS